LPGQLFPPCPPLPLPVLEDQHQQGEQKKKKVAAVSKSKKSPSGPPVPQLVMKIVVANKERKGVSLAALKKALESGGYDVKKRNNFLKQAVRRLEEKGMFLQVKCCGASGFKVNKPQQQQFAKIAVKKTAVTKVKKPAVKKRSSAGKLKKSAAASKKGKSAKSAKEPAAAAKKPAKSAKMAIVAKTQKKALKPKPVKPKKKIPKK
uniref:H15 domain-containing protein n=1 Tax=Latimeria chalumnae TaxID=7897 RepID=H2ZSH5_LATCH